MQEIAQLLVMLVTYYATFAIMGVGFATMFTGKDGAAAAGNFFFLRPLQWAGQQLRVLGMAFIAGSWRLLLQRIVDPIILAVERAVIWLVTRERGWLRRQ